MIEKQRQFALFGNFKHITFDAIVESDIRKMFDMLVNSSIDIPDITNTTQPSFQMNPAARPLLQSKDGTQSIFVGTSRIHIQQQDDMCEGYEAFMENAIALCTELYTNFDIKPYRLAYNGVFANFDNNTTSHLYDKLFNTTEFTPKKQPDEWSVMTNNASKDQKLDATINHVLSIVRQENILDNSGTPIGPLTITYDCNTSLSSSKIYSLEDCKRFSTISKDFRESSIKLCN